MATHSREPIISILLLPSHLFQLLCRVDDSYETPPLTRSCASSPDNSFSDKSFLILSNHLRFGLPLLLFPGTSITITLLPTCSSSLLNTFNLLSCTFLDISPTFVVPLILSFLILCSLVTPLIHPNILNSATSNFFSCAFFTAHVDIHRYKTSSKLVGGILDPPIVLKKISAFYYSTKP